MQPNSENQKEKAQKNELVVEYVDLPLTQRKFWLQRLVQLYEYAESLDVDQLITNKQLEKTIDQGHDAQPEQTHNQDNHS